MSISLSHHLTDAVPKSSYTRSSRYPPLGPGDCRGRFYLLQSDRKTPIVGNTVGVSRLVIWYRRAVGAAESMEPARPMLSDSREVAILTAMRRASSRVSSFAADCPWNQSWS